MNKKKFISLIQNFYKNKDLISKTISDDIRIVAWIAWGIELLFPDKSPKEMFEYMKNPDLILLKKLINKENKEFTQLSGKGYVLDSVFTIFYNKNNVSSFLNIENQLSYSPKELPYRSLVYLNALSFNLGTFYKTKKFSEMIEANSIWALPNVSYYNNRLENHKYDETVIIDNMESDSLIKEDHKDFVDKMNAYYFFIGDLKKSYILKI